MFCCKNCSYPPLREPLPLVLVKSSPPALGGASLPLPPTCSLPHFATSTTFTPFITIRHNPFSFLLTFTARQITFWRMSTGWVASMGRCDLAGLLPPTTRPETTPVSWRPVSPLQPPSTSWKHGPDPTRTAQHLLLLPISCRIPNPHISPDFFFKPHWLALNRLSDLLYYSNDIFFPTSSEEALLQSPSFSPPPNHHGVRP